MWGINIQPDLVAAIINGIDALSPLGGALVGLIWLTVGLLAWMAARDQLSQVPALMDREHWPSERLAARVERQPQARVFYPQAVGEIDREAPASSPAH
jgi:hypothetical protein